MFHLLLFCSEATVLNTVDLPIGLLAVFNLFTFNLYGSHIFKSRMDTHHSNELSKKLFMSCVEEDVGAVSMVDEAELQHRIYLSMGQIHLSVALERRAI